MNITTLPAHSVLVARDTIKMEAMADFFDHYFPLFAEFLSSTGAQPYAARAYFFSPPGETIDVAAGFLLADEDLPMIEDFVGDIGDNLVSLTRFEQMDTLRERATGSYDQLGHKWEQFIGAALEQGHELGGLSFEEYITDPRSGAEPVTDLYVALA